jgi:6-hydroxycyclohex-1-ene-1-carbonyl-CoA dehydrogenase
MSSTALTHYHAWEMHKPDPQGAGMFQEVRAPLPALGPDDVLIRIAGCGVCGTDLGYFYDPIPTVTAPPLTLGHEISGTVVAGRTDLVGSAVVSPTILPCRTCELCSRGHANACLSQKMLGRSYGRFGGFASHVVIPASEVTVVPRSVRDPIESLAVVSDAVATPYQACLRAGIERGDKVIVIGATGGLGIYAVQWARALGAALVVGVARNAAKLRGVLDAGLDLGIEMGEVATVRRKLWAFCKDRGRNPRHSWKILELTGTREGVALGLELVTYDSALVLVGYASGTIPFSFSRLMALNAQVIGSWGCDPRLYGTILGKIVASEIRIQPYVELRPMSAIRETFAELRAGRASCRRVVLTPDWESVVHERSAS